VLAKSGIMVGLGETLEEVKQVMCDQRSWGVDILTIGQYLQPSKKHLPIDRYVSLEEFAELKRFGLEIGFKWVESGPLVRSSYHAAEQVRVLSAVHRQLYGEPQPA
jgi:lipoic acid synthetase